MSKKGKVGLLFGLLAGSAFGLLFAPRKGKVLRNQFKKELDKGGSGHKTALGALKDLGKDIKESAVDLYEESELDEEVADLKVKAKSMTAKAGAKLKACKSKCLGGDKCKCKSGKCKCKSKKK